MLYLDAIRAGAILPLDTAYRSAELATSNSRKYALLGLIALRVAVFLRK
jgi:hypothetical protein